MVQVTVDLDISSVMSRLDPDKFNEAKAQGLNYAAQEMVRVLMMNSPVDHGLLKQWFIDHIDDTEAHIKTPAEYVQYVNDGTSPHMIYPVNKKMLYWEGADHPVPYVVHPGTQGQHFVEDSMDDVGSRADEFFLKAIQEVLG